MKMNKIILRGCPVCGKPGRRACLCVKCSLSRVTERETPQPTYNFDTVTEMHESNYSKRLSDGFAMLNNDY
jgi:hypothetical protein